METTVNQRFKIFLAKEDLSQTEVAKVLQCTKQAVSLMANGKQSITIQHAVLLERAFRLSTTWLLTGAGPMLFEHNVVEIEKISVPAEMWMQLKKDLEMYRAMCAKLMGIEPGKIANFLSSSLSRKQVLVGEQLGLQFPIANQLTLLMSEKKLGAVA